MTIVSRLSLAAILLSSVIGLPALMTASSGSGEPSFVPNGIARQSDTQSKPFEEIVSLRLLINSRNEVKLLNECVVSSKWEDNRVIPVGKRFYYEVVDHSGNVVAKGFRKDPRGLGGSNNMAFMLNTPYNVDCAYVNLYFVDYENGGRDGYSRNYELLGSFDVRRTQATARLN